MTIELEKTFLLKQIPEGLEQCRSIDNLDIYLPESANHPILRIRKKGDKYEMTKKYPVKEDDKSEYIEKTIPLSLEEFNDLSKLKGKRVRKIRYYYPWNNREIEVDIFQDDLKGLALADFEFNTAEEKNSFKMPDFCLADITQVEYFGGGYLAGKRYKDMEPLLEKYNYKKL